MFGIHFIKTPPTTYLLKYGKGQLKREGQGLAFFYFAPTTTLVAVPMESVDIPFIFNQITTDFQSISIQGQVTYRVVDAKQLSQLLNFTLDNKGRNYTSADPEKLPERVIHVIQVLMQSTVGQLSLRQTLSATDSLVKTVFQGLTFSKEITALGLEILGLSILSIKPTPETARALEAEIREQLLREADQAIYTRRNAAIEQERAIKENELNTEIAVENKQRQIREAQMDAELAVQEKRRQLAEKEMATKISLEKRNQEWVSLATENLKCKADAKAYSLTASMKALTGMDAKVIQALASMSMNPAQLVASAFRDLAESTAKIGQLNISPDLLKELLQSHHTYRK